MSHSGAPSLLIPPGHQQQRSSSATGREVSFLLMPSNCILSRCVAVLQYMMLLTSSHSPIGVPNGMARDKPSELRERKEDFKVMMKHIVLRANTHAL